MVACNISCTHGVNERAITQAENKLIDWRSEAAGELAIENVVNDQLQENFVAHKKPSFRGYYRYISSSIRAKYYA